MTGMGLTDKQRKFCEEYLKDHKPNEAARRAGYRGRSAGWRLMKLGAVMAHIEDLRVLKAGKYLDFVLEGLKDVAGDLTPALSTSGERAIGCGATEGRWKGDGRADPPLCFPPLNLPASDKFCPLPSRRGVSETEEMDGRAEQSLCCPPSVPTFIGTTSEEFCLPPAPEMLRIRQGRVSQIETKERLKALELLGKYLGIFKQKKKVPVKRVPEEYQVIFIERSDGNDNDEQK